MNGQYKKIDHDNKCKILGHILNADYKMTNDVKDRINKARIACGVNKNAIIENGEINTNLRLKPFDSLIGSIRLYSLNIYEVNNDSVNKLQSFYS